MRWRGVGAFVAAVALSAVPGVAGAGEPAGNRGDGDRPTVVTRLSDRTIVEASGLAVSRRHPGVLYVVNDSGDGPHLYAVGQDGATLATLTLVGAAAYDWEALAAGPGRTLWVGDIGDNQSTRETVTVYRVGEPAGLRDQQVRWRAYRLRYPDGAHDAEALLVHPVSGRVYLATKALGDPGLYAAPRRLSADGPNLLQRVGNAPLYVTGGEFAPGGARFVLRDLATAHLYSADRDHRGVVRLPRQRQGESVSWTSDGSALLVGSEGVRSAVWRVPLSGVPLASNGGTPPHLRGKGRVPGLRLNAGEGGNEEDQGPRPPGGRRIAKLVALLVVAVGLAVAVFLRRRRGR